MDLLLSGSDIAYVCKLEKSKKSSSLTVFQFSPNTFTTKSSLVEELAAPVVVLAQDLQK